MDHGNAALVALQGICPPTMAEQTWIRIEKSKRPKVNRIAGEQFSDLSWEMA